MTDHDYGIFHEKLKISIYCWWRHFSNAQKWWTLLKPFPLRSQPRDLTLQRRRSLCFFMLMRPLDSNSVPRDWKSDWSLKHWCFSQMWTYTSWSFPTGTSLNLLLLSSTTNAQSNSFCWSGSVAWRSRLPVAWEPNTSASTVDMCVMSTILSGTFFGEPGL